MANLLTAIRLLLVIPVALAIVDVSLVANWVLLALVTLAIASDYYDGKVARALNTASARGMLFDHATDFVFVTTSLLALSIIGLSTVLLPILIIVAFSQYVLDSYYLFKQKQLRMSFLGRCNGILYFTPLLIYSISRLDFLVSLQEFLNSSVIALSYVLIASTLASIIDRAIAPLRHKEIEQ
ncbi:MAG: CDP-alcohol phosphatidyltransferase family protein [Pseudohongiellaceae bacterium]